MAKKSKTVSVVGSPKSGASTASKASPTKNLVETFIPSQKSSQNEKKDRLKQVKNLTKQANDLIASASGGVLADPGKFKDILAKLQGLGKGERVQSLREKKKAAIEASRPKVTQPVVDPYRETSLDTFYDSSVFTPSPTTTYSPGYGDSGSGYTISSASMSSGPSWDQTYSQDLDKWLSQYQAEQAGRATDYQSMLTDLASQEGKFDPDLFRSLLGELESSKKRQKEWNERSARQAYKY